VSGEQEAPVHGAPTTNPAWSESQAAAVAISIGRPRRFIGLKELNLATISVAVEPGRKRRT
jgi:hypothetical protein